MRRKTLQEQLLADGYDLQGVLATLEPEASEQGTEQELEQLDGRIQRLGAINLAAIEEYQQQSERKRYPDAQDADRWKHWRHWKASSARSTRKPVIASRIPLIR